VIVGVILGVLVAARGVIGAAVVAVDEAIFDDNDHDMLKNVS
jgi:hypothetical protein